MAKTYRFKGPQYFGITASGGISHGNTYTVRVPKTGGGKEVWNDVVVGTEKTVTDAKMIKVLDVSPTWEEVVE